MKKSLNEFIKEKEKGFKYSTGELSELLEAIGLATKIVHKEINRAGLGNILGECNNNNVQGERQQKLDVLANDLFLNFLSKRNIVCGIASEENEDFIDCSDKSKESKYVILIDPLDGSSNIDVNVSVGTIFSIYKRISHIGEAVILDDFLQEGNKQVAAGYILYGSSTMLVYTTGTGVNGFTLDPSINEFFLSHPNIKYANEEAIFSINEANYNEFSKGLKEYVFFCKDKSDGKRYTGRYIGSLVADFHRNLLKGGIYIYPKTKEAPNGRLRLLYECNPIAFISVQAGGRATDGINNILDIKPISLHQRIGFYCGKKEMVDKAEEFEIKYKEKGYKVF